MKKIYILTFLSILSLTWGCNKYLDVEPISTITPENYYRNETELNAALTNIYSRLIAFGYGADGFALTSSMNFSDEVLLFFSRNLSSDAPRMGAYAYDYANSHVHALWRGMYSAISSTNFLEANIDNAKNVNQNAKNHILAQALFLRGYAYYVLGSHYGAVPLRLTPTTSENLDLARSPLEDIYVQAVKDIKAAIPHLKTSAETGTTSRISQTAAKGILARVYLTMASPGKIGLNQPQYYDSVKVYTNEIITSGQHQLNTQKQGVTIPDSSYAYIFINQARQIMEPQECMWEATFSGNDKTSTFTFRSLLGVYNGIYFAKENDDRISNSQAHSIAPRTLYNLYGTGDFRRDWNVAPYYYDTTGFKINVTPISAAKKPWPTTVTSDSWSRYFAKWRREYENVGPKSRVNSPQSFPILRYSDVLLMHAEAQLLSSTPNSADALEKVNMVRRRAYGFDITVSNLTSDLTSLNLDDIIDERQRELCGEAVRWVDLRRWGIFKTKMEYVLSQMEADGLRTAANKRFGGKAIDCKNMLVFVTNATSSTKFDLLPIPAGEISTNSLITQNPGW